jgi:GST-like protein
MCGDEFTIADMAIWPWYGALALNRIYGMAGEFLDVKSYRNVMRWAEAIDTRPAVKRGRMVNRNWGEPDFQLHERHDASDFELRTADKTGAAEG